MIGIQKSYPGVKAVDDASLVLHGGEVHALVGENGAGKSTLIKIMAGAVHADGGEMRLRGEPFHLSSGSEAYSRGLSFIHQELNLIPYLSGAENIFLGRPYPSTKWGTIDWQNLNNKANEILAELSVVARVDIPVCRLSRGGQAMISIARAFAGDASIYVMDEPTAALTEEEVHRLFRVIRLLKAKGNAILYVSHRLDEIFEICDRATIMRDGKVVASHLTGEINQETLIRYMIGRRLSETIPPSESKMGKVVLEAQNLIGEAVGPASFEVHAGEIFGIGGLAGAGRTEILRLIYGVDRVISGKMTLNEIGYAPSNPGDAIREGIVLVPEERHSQGLILNRSISNNISLPSLGTLARGGIWIDRDKETAVARNTSRAVQLKASSLEQRVSQLSGGNQQKVVFARWLVNPPLLLLLDEPSRGVDVGARFEIYRIIRDLAKTGTAILLVSSDLNELLGLSDRVMVLREGRQMATLPAQNLEQETVLRYCYGEEK